METDLAPAPLGTDRRAWRTVKFGDVARQVKVRVDPNAPGLERYIAGEHMQTDDLHIRAWGTIGDGYLGPAFHMKFTKGQVLYGSRRTYLRKVAVADIDGICANTTFVVEPANDLLIPELLPFIMQSEPFTTHSIKESKGPVNPYINWRDIAKNEFALPPKDEQRRIAEILWAADEAVQTQMGVEESLALLQSSYIAQFLQSGLSPLSPRSSTSPAERLPEGWSFVKCERLFAEPPRNGFSPQTNATGLGAPTLSISAIRDGNVVLDGNIKYAVIPAETLDRFSLKRGDILVVRGNGNRTLVGRCGIVDSVPEGCFYPDLLIRIKFDPQVLLPKFACLQWNAAPV